MISSSCIYLIIYQIGDFTKEYGTYIGDLKVIPTRSSKSVRDARTTRHTLLAYEALISKNDDI